MRAQSLKVGKGPERGFLLVKHLESGAQGGLQSLGRAWAARMLILGSKDPFHRDVWPLTPGDVTRVASIPPCGIAVREQESRAGGRIFRGTGGRWPGPARGQGAGCRVVGQHSQALVDGFIDN